jgi:NAD(P)-dependent dehydrogenase (short-subunit alcohol dehydrogenase family)
MIKCLAQEYKRFGIRFSLMHFGGVNSKFLGRHLDESPARQMLSIEAAANAVFFAATQTGEGVMAEVVLMPENHQLI